MENNKSLVFGILFASLVISGSLVFFGLQVAKEKDLDAANLKSVIAEGIDDYVNAQVRGDSGDAVAAPPSNEVEFDGDIADDDAFLGDPDAPVTVVEFSDFQCPYCRSFYNDAYREIKSRYVDTGKVKFVYRDYPLSFHKDATPAAMAAECARDQEGDEAFFAMHDKIFDGQPGGGTVAIPRESLDRYAMELALDFDDYTRCMDEEKFKAEIEADMFDGQQVGITGTPGFIINDKRVSGAQPFSVFESVIEAELNK